jgi:lysosomal alpha-mannosidase
MWQGYGPPSGFCFDDGCDDDPIMDDPDLEGYNVDAKVALFIAEVKAQASDYATNHIMLTMGSDFQYKNANQWFDNLDKLIKYVNAAQKNGTKVNVFYSTPSCYAQALQASGYSFPDKSDDFFPYANNIHSYWTGYFTSRPALKGFVRSTNNLLQICQRINAMALSGLDDTNNVVNLHEAFGILQHHDAVSGTAKQAVTNDYQKMLNKGIVGCQSVVNDAMNDLAPKSDQVPPTNEFCSYLNISVCTVSQTSDKFLVTVHNGLARELKTFARIPVESDEYTLSDPNGNTVQVQHVATFLTSQITDATRSAYQLVFPVQLPPFGYNTYYLSKNGADKNKRKAAKVNEEKNHPKDEVVDALPKCADCTLSNGLISVTFDSTTGLVGSIFDITSNTKANLTQNFYWYRGTDGSMPGNQASGAYIFRPDGTMLTVVSTNVTLSKVGKTGDYVQEMRQTFGSWVTQITRLYQGKPYVEFEWTVGPIPCSDMISREIIARYDSDIHNGGTFYTDANGRQIMTRKLNYQPTYEYQNDEPLSGNYYPVNTRIYIKDEVKQLTLLTDRSQGGSSLKNGSIELMVHRRDLYDDGFGVGEALNETGTDGRGLVVTGRHWLLLSNPSNGARRHRIYAQEMFAQPLYTFAPSTEDTFDTYISNFKTSFAGLTKPLPYNVNFLTLAEWHGTSHMLIRLEHLFQKGEDIELSRPVTVDLKGLFETFDISSMYETSLTTLEIYPNSTRTSDLTVTLQPMEIRTFIAEVANMLKVSNKQKNPYSKA